MTNAAFVFDSRWVGEHGIGRFAREIQRRIPMEALALSGKPSDPIDPLRFSRALLSESRVVFSPGYNPPLFGFSRFVFCVHDLNHIDRGENSSPLKVVYYYLILRRACRKAAAVLTVSEYSRQRLIEWAGVAPERVVNVGNGVDPSFRVDIESFNPGYPYLLCVSNRKKHKNEVRVIEGFAGAAINSNFKLLLTGSSTMELVELIDGLGVSDRVVFTGVVPESEFPQLYKGARALVFPSLYEGFGLPVIEAMACGTPVITSTTTSLPEVAGDAALLVDPESVSAISNAIEMLVTDDGLHARLAAAGIKQAAKFTWDDAAGKVRAVLEQVRGRCISGR